MSNQFFEIQWRDAIKRFQDTYELELEPLKQQLSKGKVKKDSDWFDHYSQLYLNYLKIYQKLEKCYEFSNNPQKKGILREMLMDSIKRVLIVKKDLIRFYTFTPAINSDFLNLDKTLEKMGLLPSDLDVPVPMFFLSEKDESRERVIQSLFDELHEQNVFTESHPLYSRKNPYELSFAEAVQNIVNYERGRQAIQAGLLEKEKLMQILKKHEMDQQDHINQFQNDDLKKKQNLLTVQKFIRGFFERKNYFLLKKQEAFFLEFNFDKSKLSENENKIEAILQQRKQEFLQMSREIEQNYFSIKRNLFENEGLFIKELMLDERRKFIVQKFEDSSGKELPQKLDEFYKQNEPKPEETPKGKQPAKKATKLTEEE